MIVLNMEYRQTIIPFHPTSNSRILKVTNVYRIETQDK